MTQFYAPYQWLMGNWPPALRRENEALQRELGLSRLQHSATRKELDECKDRIRELLQQNATYAESLRLANLKLGEAARKDPNYR